MKTIITIVITLVAVIGAKAQGPGHQRTNIKNHPRVNQVNGRTDKQERRIHKDEKDGKITQQQGQQDLQNLKAINQEKRTMRRNNNGHLTKAEDKALNQQLNENNKDIKGQVKKDN